MHRETSRPWWIAACGCAAIALLVRGIAWLLFRDSVLYAPIETGGHDRSIYLQALRQVAEGIYWPDGAFEHLPLYPWVAGGIAALTGNALVSAIVLGVACDMATTALIVIFARRIGAGIICATTAGMLYACYPLASVYSLLTMPNTLNALGVIAFSMTAHQLWLNAAPKRGASFFALGVLGGVVAMGFAGMLMMAAVTAAALAIRFRSARPALWLLAGMVATLLPVINHNTRAEGRLTLLTTHGGLNVYMGNHREATGYPLRIQQFRMTARDMLADAHHYAEQQAGKPMTRSESSAWWSGKARAFWLEHPLEAVWLTGKKACLFWNWRDMDDLRLLEQLRITDPVFQHWIGTPFAWFGLLGLIGLAYARNAPIPRLLLAAGMIGLVLFFITARYRLTLIPLMAVTGAAGLPVWWRHVRSREWRHLAATGAMAVVVFFPHEVRDQRPVDHYNAATQLMNAGRLSDAAGVIERGLAIAPGYAELHFARGNLLFKREQFLEAAASYERALAINPNQPTAAFNLALSLARAGDYCAARDAIRTMQQMNLPLDQRTLSLLRDVGAACEGR